MSPEYRLNDALGGHPVKVISGTGLGVGHPDLWRIVVAVGDESWPMWLPGTVLEEVAPPLPPEPDLHAVVLDGEGWAWQRTGAGWLPGGGGCRTWDVVCRHGAPTLLTLDPFAGPVLLPWRSDPPVSSQQAAVTADLGEVAISLTEYAVTGAMGSRTVAIRRTPDRAREFCRAVWAAADAAEAQR